MDRHGLCLWPLFGAVWPLAAWCLGLSQPWMAGGVLWVVWLAALGMFWRTGWHSGQGCAVLAVAMAFAGTMTLLNLWWFTAHAGAAYTHPWLANNDACRFWNGTKWLLDIPGGEVAPNFKDMGYSYLALWLLPFMRTAGIVMPLALNTLATMVTVVFTGSLCVRLVAERATWSKERLGAWGMGLCACLFYVMASGAVLVKDALVIMAVTVAVRVIAGNRGDRHEASLNPVAAVFLWCASMVLLAVLRNICVPMLAILLIIVRVANRNQAPAAMTLFMLVWAAACGILTTEWLDTANANIVMAEEGSGVDDDYRLAGDHHAALAAVIGDDRAFVTWPWWHKLLWLPVSAVVQFFIPLPWTIGSTTDFGPSQTMAHMGFGWYVVAGLVLYYLVFLMSRHGSRTLKIITVAVVAMWLCPAFALAGTVTRYALPFVPAMVPAALYALARDRRRRRFDVFMQLWILAVVLGLAAIFVLQRVLA